jgi:hypothetical protein
MATRIPEPMRPNIVVIGSIATAWAFRDLSGSGAVATKDIDLLLQPAVDAVATAASLGESLLAEGWRPHFPGGRTPGTADTPDNSLPALRLVPPDAHEGWFIEFLAVPPPNQRARRQWTRLVTPVGHFGLPSFRYMPVAVHDPFVPHTGLRVARPPCMALAHLLEHADPDWTPTSGTPGQPHRFIKDLGRAVSLWWLANEQSVRTRDAWRSYWNDAVTRISPDAAQDMKIGTRVGLASLSGHLREAHEIAAITVLAPYGTTHSIFERAYESLSEFVKEW